jgi:hypothetical protein
VEGTIMANYVRANGIKVQGPKDALNDYLKHEAKIEKLQKEIAKILKR